MKRIKTDINLQISLAAVAVCMLVFTLVRLAIWWNNSSLFAPLSGGEIASAFLNGLRFDFYICALFFGPVIFLLNLPVPFKIWTKIWAAVLLAELIVLTGFLVGDYVYFPKVGRHIGDEIIQISNDWDYIFSYILTQFWWCLALLLGAFAGMLYYLCRYINRREKTQRSWQKTTVILMSILLLIVLGLRGHLSGGKALGIANVYSYVSTSQAAALTLNGAFSAYQIGRKGVGQSSNDYPFDKALATTQKLIISTQEKVIQPEYPLMRQAAFPTATQPSKPNILIVLMEGWNPLFIDGLSGRNWGVTPVFDKILQEGVTFTQAYAVGQRSLLGLAAVLAGVPALPQLPVFGYGLEMASMTMAPRDFAQAGYYTFFAQTSHRNSFRMCALASYLGMQDSFGWEDIPQRLNYQQKAFFGYDYDLYQFAADNIAKHQDKPFFAMLFTGITHEPFVSTLPQFDRYPYDCWEHGFLNTLSFADWSIGEFLERAKKDGWFDNTIFIFVADHTSHNVSQGSIRRNFHIPLVIYAPKRLGAKKVGEVVSQLDIIPTLYELAGLNPVYTAFGRSLLQPSAQRVVLVNQGDVQGLITPDGAILHNGKQIVKAEPQTPDFNEKEAEELFLSLDKTAYTLLKENRWYNPQENTR